MSKEPKIPKDLKIEIAVNNEAAFWKRTKDQTEESTVNCERQIIINNDLLKLCEAKIEEEESKSSPLAKTPNQLPPG